MKMHREERRVSIELLAVSELHRRRGIGKALVVAVYKWAMEQGAVKCTVATQQANKDACALFESCGGIVIQVLQDFHIWMTGDGHRKDDPSSAIPNTVPYLNPKSTKAVTDLMQSSRIQTHYKYGPLCERKLENELGVKKALLVHSGTGALELCALCVGAQQGVEIIVPSFTFVSTANCFVTHGATPVLVDIRADTQNIDETKIEAAITSKTIAICVVHYAGVACEMDTIMEIARRHKLYVIEDNAHGVYGTYKGKMLGSIGDCAALSFHYTKNITCGEGGALLINNPSMFYDAFIAWEKGTNRFDFLEGKVDKYEWVGKGGSFLLSEIPAALLYSQLLEREYIMQARLSVWTKYFSAIEDLDKQGFLVRPTVPDGCGHNAHIFYILIPDKKHHELILKESKENKIGIFQHYSPLHCSAGSRFCRSLPCDQTVLTANQLLRLPLWIGMDDDHISKIVALLYSVFTRE